MGHVQWHQQMSRICEISGFHGKRTQLDTNNDRGGGVQASANRSALKSKHRDDKTPEFGAAEEDSAFIDLCKPQRSKEKYIYGGDVSLCVTSTQWKFLHNSQTNVGSILGPFK